MARSHWRDGRGGGRRRRAALAAGLADFDERAFEETALAGRDAYRLHATYTAADGTGREVKTWWVQGGEGAVYVLNATRSDAGDPIDWRDAQSVTASAHLRGSLRAAPLVPPLGLTRRFGGRPVRPFAFTRARMAAVGHLPLPCLTGRRVGASDLTSTRWTTEVYEAPDLTTHCWLWRATDRRRWSPIWRDKSCSSTAQFADIGGAAGRTSQLGGSCRTFRRTLNP